MAQLIHAKNTGKGTLYRIWSSSSDAYLTGEMTEEEIDAWTLKEAVRYVTEQHKKDFPERIERAKENGTSDMVGHTRDINGPWDKNRK
ncbi:MAG: hypothetical protein Q8Q89_02150 [bacterium]|nr:hypothetical protein [bacterium]